MEFSRSNGSTTSINELFNVWKPLFLNWICAEWVHSFGSHESANISFYCEVRSILRWLFGLCHFWNQCISCVVKARFKSWYHRTIKFTNLHCWAWSQLVTFKRFVSRFLGFRSFIACEIDHCKMRNFIGMLPNALRMDCWQLDFLSISCNFVVSSRFPVIQ